MEITMKALIPSMRYVNKWECEFTLKHTQGKQVHLYVGEKQIGIVYESELQTFLDLFPELSVLQG